MSKNPSWLDTAVFYEIYPQTFCDSNGDGIGDLPGILQKLDYLQYLGVNAVWLNPCFVSPFQDAGYDIADYYQVAPRYGTNADLRKLFEEAGKRGIRILLDLVPGHTSTDHPWFKASCRPERNKYSDWYIWTDSVWTWQAPGVQTVIGYCDRDGNYITNFFHFQPALNFGFAHPDPKYPWQQPCDAPGPQAVRQELRNIMKFWLELGASGFRVDMAGSLVKNDPERKQIKLVWQENRAWLEKEFPQAALVSEWSDPTVAIPAGFHMDFMLPFGNVAAPALFRVSEPSEMLHGCTSFFDPSGRGNICLFLDEYLPHYKATFQQGFIALPSGNHDTTPRLANGRTTADQVVAFLFLLTMPTTPFIYYGDEIGMSSPAGLVSKEGGYGRTGARTPMQWDGSPNSGFSAAPAERLYLPVDTRPEAPTVAAQRDDFNSLLQQVRRLIELRQAHPALHAGAAFEPIYAEPNHYPFVYKRSAGEETIIVALNPAARPSEISLPGSFFSKQPECLFGEKEAFSRSGEDWLLRLPPVSGGAYSASF